MTKSEPSSMEVTKTILAPPATTHLGEREEQSVIEEKTKAWQDQYLADNHLKASGIRPQGDFIPIFNRITSYIPHEATILDVGCGHGRLAIPLAEMGNCVTATDVSERMLELLRETKGKLSIDIRKGDAHRLSAEDEEFDVVLSYDFMPHFPDWPKLLEEKARVCKKGGLIIFGFNFKEHKEYCEKNGMLHYDHPYTPDIEGKKPFWAETTLEQMVSTGRKSKLELLEITPLKFITDNFMIGGTLGLEEYSKIKKHSLEILKNNKEVEEYYNWLNYNIFQKLPYFTSYHSLIVFRKMN